jgi:hypothetical protein
MYYPSTTLPVYTQTTPAPSSSQICSVCGAKVEMAYTTQHNSYHQSILDSQRYTAEKLNKLESILSRIADVDGLTLGDLVGCDEQQEQV